MASMLQDLLNPLHLPDKTENVKSVQTHISLVLVADHYVYKMKKQVHFGFLDFSTLEKRKFYCEQEILLNQRLSPHIYLEVLPVYFDGKKHTLGHGSGSIVEYAVKMLKIPDDKLMLNIYQSNQLTDEVLHRIARLLSRFHAYAETSSAISMFGKMQTVKINTDENFMQTEKYIRSTIDPSDFNLIRQWTAYFYAQHAEVFEKRIQQAKIRDCHGDLHMSHICLTDPIAVIDCIEFNDRFRYSDTLADIAFLLMDLDYHGGQTISDRLWQLYKTESGEMGMEKLLMFYRIYRAYVRGKVISFQLDDPHIHVQAKEKAANEARMYFKLAVSYIQNQG